jgi:hypothetical protein
MPPLPAFTIPQEAADVLTKPARDFYSDLTDEERAEEGIPPRVPEKAAPAPGETPAPEVEKETPEPPDEKEVEEEDGASKDDDATGKLFEEIESLREDINARLPKSQQVTDEPAEKDELMEALLEHEDPAIRGMAKRLQAAESELAANRAERAEAILEHLETEVDAEIEAAKAVLTIGGKPMDEDHVAKVAEYMEKNPAGKYLTFKEATARVFPNVVETRKPSPARRPDGKFAPAKEPAVATIVTEGGSGGGGAAKPFEPRHNETIDSAIEAFANARGWKR